LLALLGLVDQLNSSAMCRCDWNLCSPHLVLGTYFSWNKWSFTLFGSENELKQFYKNQSIKQILCSQTNNGAAFVPVPETSFAKAGIYLPSFLVGLKMAAR
jgi:hypothetical protein